MEIRYPLVLGIGIVAVIILLVIVFLKPFGNRHKYVEGKKVANSQHIENSSLYKKLYKEYKMLKNTALILLIVSVGCCFLMVSRPCETEDITDKMENRDIMICMDVSTSMDEINLEFCEKIREMVKRLDGQRIGITIFNSRAVVIAPLTDDYEYVNGELEKLEKAIKSFMEGNETDMMLYSYLYEGTVDNKGSSIIGDGLASALYNFPDLETNKDRTRVILITTDNQLSGTPIVTLDEACALCREYEVSVYAMTPTTLEDEAGFNKAINSTNGKVYTSTSKDMYDKIIEEIEKLDTSVYEKTQIIRYDKPEFAFICMTVLIFVYFALSRKVKL